MNKGKFLILLIEYAQDYIQENGLICDLRKIRDFVWYYYEKHNIKPPMTKKDLMDMLLKKS